MIPQYRTLKSKLPKYRLKKKQQQQQQKTKNKNKKKQVDTVILPYSCFIWLKVSITLIRAETES